MKVLSARQFTAWKKKNEIPEEHIMKSFDNWWYGRDVVGRDIPEQYCKGVLVVWATRAYSVTQKRRGTVLKAIVDMRIGGGFEPHLGPIEKGAPAKAAE